MNSYLHVITVISNPCNYARRYELAHAFVARMEKTPNVILYVVELVYGAQPFVITSPDNRRHLQLRTDTAPLWHKENMINLGVRNLLPSGWKEFAWIDCDLDFMSASWVRDTIRLLNGPFDVVQLFSNVIDMDREEKPVGIFTGFGKNHSGKKKGTPGFAWACNRAAYTSMGGLPQFAIIGGGDNILALSMINQVLSLTQKFDFSNDLKNHMLAFQGKVHGLRLGHVPGTIRHYFHGSRKNRQYQDRKKILVKYSFAPSSMLTEDNKTGLIVPTEACDHGLLLDIMNYFEERKEDD